MTRIRRTDLLPSAGASALALALASGGVVRPRTGRRQIVIALSALGAMGRQKAPGLGRFETYRTPREPLSVSAVSESGLLRTIHPRTGSRARNLAYQAFPVLQLGRSRTHRFLPGSLGVSGLRRRVTDGVLLSGDPATRDELTDVGADSNHPLSPRRLARRGWREFITPAKGVAGSQLVVASC